MRVTKFTHSCLLVEHDSSSVLFDPGQWSWKEGGFNFSAITKLDAIVITHNHGDHCWADFVKALLTQFPAVKIVANNEVTTSLQQAGIAADFLPETANIRPFNAPHAALPAGPAPANTGYNFGDVFSHPGDSIDFKQTKPILALPYVAPWGSPAEAVELVRRLKPQKVLPIHDWHLSDEGRGWYADFLSRVLAQHNIQFVALSDGQPIEL